MNAFLKRENYQRNHTPKLCNPLLVATYQFRNIDIQYIMTQNANNVLMSWMCKIANFLDILILNKQFLTTRECSWARHVNQNEEDPVIRLLSSMSLHPLPCLAKNTQQVRKACDCCLTEVGMLTLANQNYVSILFPSGPQSLTNT